MRCWWISDPFETHDFSWLRFTLTSHSIIITPQYWIFVSRCQDTSLYWCVFWICNLLYVYLLYIHLHITVHIPTYHISSYMIYIYIHMTIYADVHMHVKGSLNKIPETPRAYSLPYRDLGYAPEVPQVLPNHLTMSMFVSYYTVATYQCIHMLIIYNVDTYVYIYIHYI